MVGALKRFLTLLFAVAVLCAAAVNAEAAFDGRKWEDAPVYVLLEANSESNSDLCFAAVKVRYSKEINRVHILYMLEFESYSDPALCGVIMDFNDMGRVTIMADGTVEFDQDIYYAELNNVLSDKNSMNIILEVTVGIKSGIPDDLILDTYVFDTNGIKSNEYSNDISEEIDSPEGSDDEQSSESAEKTTKVKTTKTKTTKVKTTKTKKAKTKANTSKSSSKENAEPDEYVEFDGGKNEYSVDVDSEDVESDNERKNLMLIFAASAAVVAIATACSVAMKSKNKRKDRGHEDE